MTSAAHYVPLARPSQSAQGSAAKFSKAPAISASCGMACSQASPDAGYTSKGPNSLCCHTSEITCFMMSARPASQLQHSILSTSVIRCGTNTLCDNPDSQQPSSQLHTYQLRLTELGHWVGPTNTISQHSTAARSSHATSQQTVGVIAAIAPCSSAPVHTIDRRPTSLTCSHTAAVTPALAPSCLGAACRSCRRSRARAHCRQTPDIAGVIFCKLVQNGVQGQFRVPASCCCKHFTPRGPPCLCTLDVKCGLNVCGGGRDLGDKHGEVFVILLAAPADNSKGMHAGREKGSVSCWKSNVGLKFVAVGLGHKDS